MDLISALIAIFRGMFGSNRASKGLGNARTNERRSLLAGGHTRPINLNLAATAEHYADDDDDDEDDVMGKGKRSGNGKEIAERLGPNSIFAPPEFKRRRSAILPHCYLSRFLLHIAHKRKTSGCHLSAVTQLVIVRLSVRRFIESKERSLARFSTYIATRLYT